MDIYTEISILQWWVLLWWPS